MYLLLVISALLMTANTALTKLFQKTTPSGVFHMLVYNLINAAFACVFFWVSAGFKISVSIETIVYAVVYALIICINLSAQIFAFSRAPVSVVTLMTMAGGVLLPSVFGIIKFNEPLTLRLFFSSVLIIIAAVLPFAGKRGEKKAFSVSAAAVCLLMFVLSGLSVILLKLYALDTRVCDSESMFFLTNAAIVIICAAVLAIIRIKKGESGFFKKILRAYAPIHLLNIVSKTALANIASVLQVIILAEMAASTFSVLNSALTLLGAGAVSTLLFREKQSVLSVAALALAAVAIVINPT
ncbi:MAG: hypothetical protein IJ299_02585 [Oscillospiraceae bacterium]|nr:hypothetical protein [Oscillospiraceae bacterium]